MTYLNTARNAMVNTQVTPNKITDERIIDAFLSVDRAEFVDPKFKKVAYSDARLPIAKSRTMLQAEVLGRMIQALELQENHKVLVVGCGTGYTVALISAIAANVMGVESNHVLCSKAAKILSDAKITNFSIINTEALMGNPMNAPYNAIILDGAVTKCPKILLDQLALEGRLVCIERDADSSRVVLYENSNNSIARMELFAGFAEFIV